MARRPLSRTRRPASSRVLRNRARLAGGALTVVVALVATLLAGRGGDGGDQHIAADGKATTSGPAASVPAASGAPPQGGRGSGAAVTLAFGGDIHFEGRIRARLSTGPSTVLAGVAPLLQSADVAVVNLETAVTTRGAKPPTKHYAFRAPPAAFAALKAGGVDVASMANNHGMDFGRQGLEDSLDASAAEGLPVVGIGRNAEEAYRPFTTVVRGQRIAILGATQVLDDDLRADWTATDHQSGLASAKEVDRLVAAVRSARQEADTVVVYLHWGTEGETCPNPAQPPLARTLAEAGADVIVGGHAHRLQGAGRLGPALVAYGLGNFVFYTDTGPGTETGVLTVTVTGREVGDYRWSPARLVNQVPRRLRGAAATQATAAFDQLRDCTDLRP